MKIASRSEDCAVADVVEAMSSHHPYRPPYPIEEVLAELERQRGKLYNA